MALAEAALTRADHVLFVLPRVFPHKQYEGASLAQRLAMLQTIAADNERWAIGISEQGMFIDIAREAKEHFPDADLWFACGRDAAERIVGWDYGNPGAFA